MKQALVLIATFVCTSGLSPAIDKQLLGLMMPDAKVVAGVNVQQVRISPYGQYSLSKFPVTDPHFQEFVSATGFDPTRDITEIVAAAPDVQGGPKGLAAARGVFNVGRIVDFVKQMNGTVDQSLGVAIVASPDGQAGIALLDNSLAIAGDLKSVVAAVARRSTATTFSNALSTRAETLSTSFDAWVISTLPVPNAPSGVAPGGLNLTALQSIQQSSAGVKFGTSVNLTAEAVADTAQNANALADVLRLLVGLVQMNQGNAQAAQLTPLLKTVSIQTRGTTVEVSLSIPEDVFEQLGPRMQPGTRHRRVVARRP